MILDIVYFEQRSQAGIMIPMYKIIKEDEDSYIKMLEEIEARGVEDVIMYGVEIKNVSVDYDTGMITIPRWGVKCHISSIIMEGKYGDIIKAGKYKVKELLK